MCIAKHLFNSTLIVDMPRTFASHWDKERLEVFGSKHLIFLYFYFKICMRVCRLPVGWKHSRGSTWSGKISPSQRLSSQEQSEETVETEMQPWPERSRLVLSLWTSEWSRVCQHNRTSECLIVKYYTDNVPWGRKPTNTESCMIELSSPLRSRGEITIRL